MAIYPSPDKLDKMESKYALVILAAKRARQVKDGARRLTDSRSPNPITVALEEFAAGVIIPRVVEDATVAAQQAALTPHEPSLEDIIGAGPVLVVEPEKGSAAAQMKALRNAEPDSNDDLTEDDDMHGDDAFGMEGSSLLENLDDEDELVTDDEADEE